MLDLSGSLRLPTDRGIQKPLGGPSVDLDENPPDSPENVDKNFPSDRLSLAAVGPYISSVLETKIESEADRDIAVEGPAPARTDDLGVVFQPFIEGRPSGGSGQASELIDELQGD